ncbi:MAG: F0F1 ATP synthase subunit A [Fibrobacterales bacterium]|nr:F0F1 ATP synthase subunit A [Fibrobacterales bacterium]MBP5189132.1 F0F1 ATP synthase subunit A [Fibrobacterales bacterium]MBP5351228.1 F0F1 ATP synthase subunit A [Fibrobacterales bacterium]
MEEGSDGLGALSEFLLHHVADNREVWRIFPGVEIPLGGSLKVGGIELFPSLHVCMMLLAFLLLVVLLGRGSRRKEGGDLPAGKFASMVEAMVLFVRDDIVAPNLGRARAAKWMPFFCTLFFFLLALNLIGLVPGFAAATGNPNFTAAMAAMVFVVFNAAGMAANGGAGYWKGIVPKGVPWPILLILVPIELFGLVTKSAALAIRLFANMAAGHIVIFSLLALGTVVNMLFAMPKLSLGAVQPVAVLFAACIECLELFVAFLQAYIFTLLSALFVGGAVRQEH